MNITTHARNTRALLLLAATAVLSTAFASSAKAACPDSFKPKALSIPGANRPSLGAQTLRQGPQGANEGPDPTIVGLWKVTVRQDGQVIDEGFDAWHGDGTETLNDSVPPSTGNVCLGVWEKSGRRLYKLKHLSWNYDETGKAIGVVVIRELVKLDRGGNNYEGTATIEFYDLHENLLFQFGADITARRITVN